jgi:purine-cytosine permease-like protein
MSTLEDRPDVAPAASGLGIETNGLNTIQEHERKGSPRQLFWPWFAANVSVLGLGYGSFLLGFGVSFWQATIIGIVGIVVSFLFCGFIALTGRRGSAPTMVLSRAVFGINGNRLPSVLSWILTVGWETVLTSTAVLATATVFGRLGWGDGDVTKVIALIVVAALIVISGVFGFNLIMRLQVVITIVTGVLTIVYIILVAHNIDWATLGAIKDGGAPQVIGGLVFMMTGFGLGWVNAAADYSRYLPKKASGSGIVFWTTLGSSLAPIILLIFGLMLAGSSPALAKAIGNDPVGALTTALPIWFLIPFIIVAVLGLVGGAVLDIYSSGLALLSAGLKVPRYVAAGIDGVLMIAGSIYVVFFASDFFYPFQGFLITLGVPIAAWCGIFLADVLLRRKDYAEADLYTASGRYGSVRWLPIILIVVGTAIGWGLVTNTYAPWLEWQGYLLGGLTKDWGGANLGVLAALIIGFVGQLFSVGSLRRQEALPLPAATSAGAK